MRHCFLCEVEIKVVFSLKISCFLFARSWQLTFKGFPSFAHWPARLTKIQNVCFCPVIEFTFYSYAIQEKFTAWLVNSTLNFTRKTDIARIAKRWVRYRFFAWNLTWNSRVRQWNFSIVSSQQSGLTNQFLKLIIRDQSVSVTKQEKWQLRGGERDSFSSPQFRRYAEENIKKERICALGYELSHIQFLQNMLLKREIWKLIVKWRNQLLQSVTA